MLKFIEKERDGQMYVRKGWFKVIKQLLHLIVKKPRFIYLGEPAHSGGIILSNHEGPKSPVSLELYFPVPHRQWGAYEMNESLKSAYRYQSVIYFHQKKHWPLRLAQLFCLIATPVTYLYYKGIYLISSYPDIRFKRTLKEGVETLKAGHSVVIFPEVSDRGYFKELTGFYPGAVLFFQYCRRHGLNVPVHVAYLQRESRNFIFDAPTTVNELLDLGLNKTELAQKLCDRCNELGRMTF